MQSMGEQMASAEQLDDTFNPAEDVAAALDDTLVHGEELDAAHKYRRRLGDISPTAARQAWN